MSAAPRPIRVLQLLAPTGFYGAERWVLALARHLDARRVRTSVVCFGDKPGAAAVAAALRAAGVEATRLAARGRIAPRGVLALRALLLRDGVDVVHAHGLKSDVVAYLATRGTGVRAVTTPHGWSASEGPRMALYEAVARRVLPSFDAVYPLSRGLADDLVACGVPPARVRLIPNAVDDGPLDAVHRARTAAGGRWRGRLLFVGRLIPQKGLAELLDAFAQAALPAGTRLGIAGQGPMADALVSRARALGVAERVDLLGYVADVRPLLRDADALVLPSHSEGLPRVLLEACAAGVVAVASDIPGVREVLRDGDTGLLAPARDAGALARVLERVAADAALRARLVAAARDTVAARFTARRMAADYEGAYAVLLERAGEARAS